MTLLMTTGSLTIAAGAVIFLVITLILVGALLAAKAKLVPSGNVDLKVNGEKDIETPIGSTLLAGLQSGGIFLQRYSKPRKAFFTLSAVTKLSLSIIS